ncbi:SARP family transcriptional regulator [Streptomyces spinoverrucosus]|uniref:AfsR/SARP family transcriptional regulator n=1 Tax=Streptomyces spinoverrucosus TaxID=284043 RepID=UPI0018C3FFE7|nr:BTAD domain-containing putative transcriptional regulator [Streptomyces spinoverrucosus]MBG0850627.1 SARP family transcriptional regulator [Streptomyces spinoverrucosus]
MSISAFPPRLRLLGQFRLEFGAEPVNLCMNGQRLLAFLALRKCATRGELAGTLWPDTTEERARGSLRTTLWKLPRESQPLIHCHGETMAITNQVRVDAHALAETALGLVRSRGSQGDGAAPMDLLTCGDLLPGWAEDWVLFERERLRQLRLHALDELAESLARRGSPALALEAALASVRIEPLRESAHRAVVSAHLREGNVIEAIRHYRAFRRLLREELGVEPSRALAEMIPAPYR